MLILRPSHVDCYLTCGRQFYYRYVVGLVSTSGAANLYFGTSIHYAIEAFLKKTSPNPEEVFVRKWMELTANNIVEYPSPFDRESLKETGRYLIRAFVAWWPSTGFQPVRLADGRLAVEIPLRVRLSDDIILTGTPDLLVENDESAGPLDFKAVRTKHDPLFAELADQLTAYYLLIEHNRHLFQLNGKPLNVGGFVDLKKCKVPKPLKRDATKYPKNAAFPTVFPPEYVGARSPELIEEYVAKVKWVGRNIREGNFFRRPAKAFDSPCPNCDYRYHCAKGECKDLTLSGTPPFREHSIVPDLDKIPIAC